MMVTRHRGPPIRHRRVLLLLAAAALAAPLRAQFSEHVDVHAIEVPVIVRDAKGEVPRDLTPADFELRESGVVQKIIGVSYAEEAEAAAPVIGAAPAAAPPSHGNVRRGEVVIYLQQTLGTTAGLRESARALAAQADALVRSADVEIVSDFPGLHVVSRATSNGAALRRVLEDLAVHGRGQEQILALREHALLVEADPLQTGGALARKGGPGTSAGALEALEEQNIIRRAQMNFTTWMLRYPRVDGRTGRTLILVSDGFDYDQSFFDQLFKADDNPAVTHESAFPARDQDSLSRALAAEGWSIYCLAPGAKWMSASGIVESRRSASSKVPFQTTLVRNVLNPLNSLAAESGGLVETDAGKVGSDLEKLSQRIVITYQVRRPRDDVARRIAIRALRPGLRVTTTHWSTVGTPESVNTARALTFAAGHDEPGDLPVTCALRVGEDGQESLAVRVDFSPIDALRAGMHAATLRVAIAATPEHALPFTMAQRMTLDLAAQPRWELTIPMNGRHGAAVATSVEEPSSGAWGGARCKEP